MKSKEQDELPSTGCCSPLKDAQKLLAKYFDFLEIKANEPPMQNHDENIKYVNSFLPRDLSLFNIKDLKKIKEVAEDHSFEIKVREM